MAPYERGVKGYCLYPHHIITGFHPPPKPSRPKNATIINGAREVADIVWSGKGHQDLQFFVTNNGSMMKIRTK